jgi:hypothetical protein
MPEHEFEIDPQHLSNGRFAATCETHVAKGSFLQQAPTASERRAILGLIRA